MAGSLGYAGRLKNKRNLGGQLGAKEYIEDVETVRDKVQQLADMVLTSKAQSKKVFFFTGAGISTSIGIPDFRGPTGIWTLKKKKLPITAPLTPFEHAKPSFTHMVIAAMAGSGYVNMVCSQNVDSLHLRSGVPRPVLAELHGNCFAERCASCKYERVRDFQVETLGFKTTGRHCSRAQCGGVMIDNVLDWDSALPDDELDASIAAAETAGVCLVLGSSLQIAPANEIPVFTSENGGKLVIVNLQKTPRDRNAALILRARVDAVMALLAVRLGLPVPPYVRQDGVVICHAALPLPSTTHTTTATAAATEPVIYGSDPAHLPVTASAPADGDTTSGTVNVLMPKHEPESKEPGSQPGTSPPQAAHQNGAEVKTEAAQAAQVASPTGPWGFRLLVRSVHGQGCLMPMVSAVSVKVESAQQQGVAGQVEVLSVGCAAGGATAGQQHNGLEPAEEAAAPEGSADGVPAVQGREGYTTAHTPKVSGGVPLGGPYEFRVSGVSAEVSSVTCSVRLHLTEWADDDKRVVTLPPYSVTWDSVSDSQTAGSYPSDTVAASAVDSTGLCLPGQAPASQVQQVLGAAQAAQPTVGAGNGQASDQAADAVQRSTSAAIICGPCPAVVARGDRLAVSSFVSQALQYDAEAVWGAYEADPPPVVAPPPPKAKKAKTEAKLSAEQLAQAAGVELRRSARRGAASAVAAVVAAAGAGSELGSDDFDV